MHPSPMRSLKGLLPDELERVALANGGPRFAGRQMLEWLYRRGVGSFGEMTNLRRQLRERLATGYRIAEGAVLGESRAGDGTVKLLIGLSDGARIESVLIPETGRLTLCVSTQAGCARACAFCATGRMGLKRGLTAGEIVEQAVIARRYGNVSNVVFMGMGEPLDNYDQVRRAAALLAEPHALGIAHRHLTLSTVGVVPGIRKLAEDDLPVRLTVSLAAPEDELRSRLQPVNREWSLDELVRAVEEHAARTGRRPTIAYVMLKGINDSPLQATRLAGLAHRARAKVNLIPFNPSTPGGRPAAAGRSGLRPPPGLERSSRARASDRSKGSAEHRYLPPGDDAVLRFQTRLKERGVLAFLRRGRGGEIGAACGQLDASTRYRVQGAKGPDSAPEESARTRKGARGLPWPREEKA